MRPTDINATKSNRSGPQTAIAMARSSGHHQCVELLKRLGAVPPSTGGHVINTSVQLLTFKDTAPSDFIAPISKGSGNSFFPPFSLSCTHGKLTKRTTAPSMQRIRRAHQDAPEACVAISATNQLQTQSGPWKTVRLFISSTFADMHAERDYLIKSVIPKLRERCFARRLHLVDIDLRWVRRCVVLDSRV